MAGAVDEGILRAVRKYNAGDYLACHETLESTVADSAGERSELARSLTMLATAMHLQFHRGGGSGVINLVRQCVLVLDSLPPVVEGVATRDLSAALSAFLQELLERRKPGASFLDRWLVPRIPLR